MAKGAKCKKKNIQCLVISFEMFPVKAKLKDRPIRKRHQTITTAKLHNNYPMESKKILKIEKEIGDG